MCNKKVSARHARFILLLLLFISFNPVYACPGSYGIRFEGPVGGPFTQTQSISFYTSWGFTCTYSIYNIDPALNISPTSGSLPISSSQSISSSFNISLASLPVGTHSYPYTLYSTMTGGFTPNTFSLQATVVVEGFPEIGVSSSVSGLIADGGSDLQGAVPAGTSRTITYTVNNTDLGDLLLSPVTSSNESNVSINSISSVASTVAPSGSTTFTVNYTPTIAGGFSFDLQLPNNDDDENPFNYTVIGTATGDPEVELSSSESGVVLDGGADTQGAVPAGASKSVSYTISNSGYNVLNVAHATIADLNNVNVTSVSVPTTSTVPPVGGTSNFDLSYIPTLAGPYSFELSFTSNDSDESPYTITVSGNATGDPELDVASSETGLVSDGGTEAHGTMPAGASKTTTYTVSNSGLANLDLASITTGNTSNVTVDSISAVGSSSVVPGGATTFALVYTPEIAGVFSFDLFIANNDVDESTFSVSINGTATGDPEIEVSSSEVGVVVDGGTDAQGDEPAGIAKTVTYTLNNIGLANLNVAGPNLSGEDNVTVDSISSLGTTTLEPGESTTFTVTYTPTFARSYSFNLTLTSNDADESMYNIEVSGTGTGDPEIEVLSSENGPVVSSGTDPQLTGEAGISKTVIYTIDNTSLADFTLQTNHANVTNVTVQPVPSIVVLAGQSVSVVVNYTPTYAGPYSFDLSFVSEETADVLFDISVGGASTGEPEISVRFGSSEIVNGGTSASGSSGPYFGEVDFLSGSASRTFNIRNEGLDTLNLGAASASIIGSDADDFSIVSQPVAALAPGMQTSVVISFDPNSYGRKTAFLSIVNDDSDESPFNFAISGDATGAGTITIAQNIFGEDIAVAYFSSTPSLNFSLSSDDGFSQQRVDELVPGSYTVSAENTEDLGYALTGISCNNDSLLIDVNARSVTVDLAPNEDIMCSFDFLESRSYTSEIIKDYLRVRGLSLLSLQPSRERRIRRFNSQYVTDSQQGGLVANGHSLPVLLPFNLSLSQEKISFDASLKRKYNTTTGVLNGVNYQYTEKQWDLWVEGQFVRVKGKADSDGKLGVIYAGADYMVNSELVLGVMAQVDQLKLNRRAAPFQSGLSETSAASVEGVGWMLGPYVTQKVSDNMYLDARASWGRSSNRISPLGHYEDAFDTDRWLVTAAVVGEYEWDTQEGASWHVSPTMELKYLEEKQLAYTDFYGVRIPEQTVNQGDARIGPRISYSFDSDAGTRISPWLEVAAVAGISIGDEEPMASAKSRSERISGSVKAGVNSELSNGSHFSLSVQVNRIGGLNESYGGAVHLNVPLR